MSIKYFTILSFVILWSTTLIGQNKSDEVIDYFSYFGEFSLTAIGASENNNPFWTHTNTNSAIGQFSNFSTTASLGGKYSYKENVSIEAGIAYFYRNGIEVDDFQRRDLYARFTNTWLKVTLGSKKQDEVAEGLSASNKNFLWSGDARPLAGLIIEANNPLKLNNTFGIDWGIAHYKLNDDRFVDDARVHYKRLGLHIKVNEKSRFYARIQHFVQWGGISESVGPRDVSFGSFVDVFTAKQTGSRANAEGNHLGSYFLEYYLKSKTGQFNVYHDHPIEDGSGTRLANFPDGIWGITFAPSGNNLFDMFLYEYIDTTDQSGSNISGRDSYFNNRGYKSGWYFENQNIGLPFLTVRINSRVRVHHFGLKGHYKKFDVSLKATSARSLGTFFSESTFNEKAFYSYANVTYNTESWGAISLVTGYDISDIVNNTIGAGVSYTMKF